MRLHSQTIVRRKVRTNVKAGVVHNHNQTKLRVRSGVKAGALSIIQNIR